MVNGVALSIQMTHIDVDVEIAPGLVAKCDPERSNQNWVRDDPDQWYYIVDSVIGERTIINNLYD